MAVNFEDGLNNDYSTRSRQSAAAGPLVKLVFKLSGGAISTVKGANNLLVFISLVFFALAGFVLWSSLS